MTIFSLRRHGMGLGISPRRRAAPDAGSGPPGDTEAPSVPENLVATAVSSSEIGLTWDASTDNVGVTGYNIYRDNVLIDTSASNSYSDTGLSPGTYSYEVSDRSARTRPPWRSGSAGRSGPRCRRAVQSQRPEPRGVAG